MESVAGRDGVGECEFGGRFGLVIGGTTGARQKSAEGKERRLGISNSKLGLARSLKLARHGALQSQKAIRGLHNSVHTAIIIGSRFLFRF